ncbi:hypothetical protein [Ruminococcus sp. HUN007]|uniref:hypothetical protein n=1 Tax=Ruminococcus sp. HUN007 TaxID=1514668 RepID=UPI0005D2698C|nr:hypothetical protein [Ruminococcus sp. HUN007]
MHKNAESFAKYCDENYDLGGIQPIPSYQSLSICIIDCIFSLRAKYYQHTLPVIHRYADKYLNGDIYSASDTITSFIKHMDEYGATEFAKTVLQNNQRSGGVLKTEVCYKIAKYLSYIKIETMSDFQNFEDTEFIEKILYSVKGLGNAGVDYLFMMAGDTDRCKVDVHINHCIWDFCHANMPPNEIQELFRDAVSMLKEKYPDLTVGMLDRTIWNEYQKS